jgi:hypothetical protein
MQGQYRAVRSHHLKRLMRQISSAWETRAAVRAVDDVAGKSDPNMGVLTSLLEDAEAVAAKMLAETEDVGR